MSLCRLLVRRCSSSPLTSWTCFAGSNQPSFSTKSAITFNTCHKKSITRTSIPWRARAPQRNFEQEDNNKRRWHFTAGALGLFSFAFWRGDSSDNETSNEEKQKSPMGKTDERKADNKHETGMSCTVTISDAYYRNGALCKIHPIDLKDLLVKFAQSFFRLSGNIWKDVKITLYQYQTCPFCTKARTFLQYYQIPFEIVEVHPIFKKEIKFAQKKKVPVVLIETRDGTQEVQDSSLIMSVISTYMSNNGKRSFKDIMNDYPCTEIEDENGKKKEVVLNKYWILTEEPDKAVQIEEEDPRQMEVQWRRWTDDHLVHLISPNVYRTLRESYQAFAHHVELGKFKGTWEGIVAKVGGSVAMWGISKKLKKKYCKDADVRMDLYRACNEWCKALGKKKFMGGDQPNLADLSVYAVINVTEGLISFEDLTTYTKIQPWYERVKAAVKEKQDALVQNDDS